MQIIKNYIESLPMNVNEEGTIWVVDEHELTIMDRRLTCACRYIDKCGIPCSHLVKLIVLLHEDILNYIHKRWQLQVIKDQNKYTIKKGRPRNSRRNRK